MNNVMHSKLKVASMFIYLLVFHGYNTRAHSSHLPLSTLGKFPLESSFDVFFYMYYII